MINVKIVLLQSCIPIVWNSWWHWRKISAAATTRTWKMEKFHKRKKTFTLAGVSMARVLTDSDTEAMIQRVQPEERDEVNVLFLLSLSFFFLLNFVWLFCWYQSACMLTCCSNNFLILLILLRSTPFLRSTKSWGGKSPQTHSAAREWLRWFEKKISHNLNNNIFSSETTGFEQQSTASKRRAAPHRTHWGEGGEQHRSLTRAGYHHHHHDIITIIIIIIIWLAQEEVVLLCDMNEEDEEKEEDDFEEVEFLWEKSVI